MAQEALAEARTMAAGLATVHRALGDEANDEARASERARIVDLHLERFNALLREAGREPVTHRAGGRPKLQHALLVVAMEEAAR